MKRYLRYIATAAGVALVALTIAALPAMAEPGNGKSAENANATSKVAEAAGGVETLSSGKADHSRGNAGTSGDPTQPQPRSNADDNGTGANVEGPYDSTRDGSPSLNGNGGGKATGKPCAGCVGKADNKNPKGQMPNGSDANNGYECDGNNGIGKTNPAHTGCEPGGEEPPCVDDTSTPEDECDPEEPCVDDMNTPEDECNPEEEEPDVVLDDRIDRPGKPDEVLPDRLDRPGVRGAILPFTGGSVADLSAMALVLIVAGSVLVGLRRIRGDEA